MAIALFDYTGGHRPDSELVFKEDDLIEILERPEKGGWWRGRKLGKEGWFPQSYVELR